MKAGLESVSGWLTCVSLDCDDPGRLQDLADAVARHGGGHAAVHDAVARRHRDGGHRGLDPAGDGAFLLLHVAAGSPTPRPAGGQLAVRDARAGRGEPGDRPAVARDRVVVVLDHHGDLLGARDLQQTRRGLRDGAAGRLVGGHLVVQRDLVGHGREALDLPSGSAPEAVDPVEVTPATARATTEVAATQEAAVRVRTGRRMREPFEARTDGEDRPPGPFAPVGPECPGGHLAT